MNRQRVMSSNLRSVGYDTEKRVLEVEFQDDSIYRYGRVPASVYRGLLAATSKGGFLAAHVRGIYPYARVEDE